MRSTVFLVHGPFVDSSSWDEVAARLRSWHRTVAVAVPLRGVAEDAAYLDDLVGSISGPVVLVGHSYGGAVISAVRPDAGDVTALVYVAGFAPEQGETCAGLSGRFPGGSLAETLVPVDLAGGSRDLYVDQARYHQQLCADVPETVAERMATSQCPVLERALTEPCPEPLWRRVHSWFVYGELDRTVPAAAHRFMAERAGSRRTVGVAGGSHVVGITAAEATADLVAEAAAVAHSRRT
jgi:pimeloyl-ACP methyl ester carboxylesterase